MSELRAYSTRARLTPTSFVNDYSFGSFKGNEDAWMEKYFDAFLYLAKQPKNYDQALKFLVDLRDLAARGKGSGFGLRVEVLRQAQAKKPSILHRPAPEGGVVMATGKQRKASVKQTA